MRLYLNAESKNHIGYIPDWLKVSFEENDEDFELTLDIRGEFDYERDCLSCRCKGDFDPWVLYNNENGDETDLCNLTEKEVEDMFPVKKIVEILQHGTDFRVGLYPVNDSEETFELAEEDVLSNCTGLCELYDGENTHEIRFNFETELSMY